MTYNDPTILHTAECQTCGWTFADADVLNDNGDCPECEQAKEQEPDIMDAVRDDFFNVACDIALAGQGRVMGRAA